jgi:hypothetical protein
MMMVVGRWDPLASAIALVSSSEIEVEYEVTYTKSMSKVKVKVKTLETPPLSTRRYYQEPQYRLPIKVW